MSKLIVLAITSVIIASLSQLLLKKAAQKKHGSIIKEYLNAPVIAAYGLLGLTTVLNTIASRKLPLTLMSAIDSLGYVFILILSFFVLKEAISLKKLLGMGLIVAGVLIFALV